MFFYAHIEHPWLFFHGIFILIYELEKEGEKGAALTDHSAVVIPGSKGSLTYLVMPVNDTAALGYSLAHGAGRKWERSLCKPRLANMEDYSHF